MPQVLGTSAGLLSLYGLERIGVVQDDAWRYVQADALGPVRQWTDPLGAVVGLQAYAPYGEPLVPLGPPLAPWGFTGEWEEPTGLVYLRARWYASSQGRLTQVDADRGASVAPATQHPYAYALSNPLRYVDPTGRTVRSALGLVRRYRRLIVASAKASGVDPVLLAGVVFAENRNDYNWSRGADWSSAIGLGVVGVPEIKNVFGPVVKANASVGITEVSVAVAALMDNPLLIPEDYVGMSYKERNQFHDWVARSLCVVQRILILHSLWDPRVSLSYAARYLRFLGEHRDYGGDLALWLSDYNRGLSDWDTTTEYGRRIDVYRHEIHVALWGR